MFNPENFVCKINITDVIFVLLPIGNFVKNYCDIKKKSVKLGNYLENFNNMNL